MSFNFNQGTPIPISQEKVQEAFTAVMQRVYLWMSLGLLLTAGVAIFTASSPALLSIIFSSRLVFFGLFIVEIGLVLAISAAINRLSPPVAIAMFFVYAAVNGLTLSVIFLVYELGSIWLSFGVTAVLFGIMSIIGYTTKEDLTSWGRILFMGLIGLIVASIANMFLASSALDWIITYAGILIFLGLTVYDSQRIKVMSVAVAISGDSAMMERVGVLGALRLYLDFINLFLYILRLLGRRK